MMNFVSAPVTFQREENALSVVRNIEDVVAMIDNLVELIVFTPRGSFTADPDFGFEYWNYEYSNVSYRDFNNGHGALPRFGNDEATKKMCQNSIRNSLEAYAPQLKHIDILLEMNAIGADRQPRKRIFSSCFIFVSPIIFISWHTRGQRSCTEPLPGRAPHPRRLRL